MPTTAQIKEARGYTPKPVQRTCSNCAAFTSERSLAQWQLEYNERSVASPYYKPYTVEQHGRERNLRCADAGHAVTKLASCNHWRPKET